MFFYEVKQVLMKFLRLRPSGVILTTLKNVFSSCNFSDNSVQVLSPMHSNEQLMYLLLFFAVVVGAAVLIV